MTSSGDRPPQARDWHRTLRQVSISVLFGDQVLEV